jgi:hypothetical protein
MGISIHAINLYASESTHATNSNSEELFSIGELRSIPDNIAQIITELPKFVENENYLQDYKDVYLAVKNNQKIVEYDLIKPAIENALSLLQKYQSSSSDSEIYHNMVNELNNYYHAIVTESKFIPTADELNQTTRKSRKSKSFCSVCAKNIKTGTLHACNINAGSRVNTPCLTADNVTTTALDACTATIKNLNLCGSFCVNGTCIDPT